jgi:hypothetical protein
MDVWSSSYSGLRCSSTVRGCGLESGWEAKVAALKIVFRHFGFSSILVPFLSLGWPNRQLTSWSACDLGVQDGARPQPLSFFDVSFVNGRIGLQGQHVHHITFSFAMVQVNKHTRSLRKNFH